MNRSKLIADEEWPLGMAAPATAGMLPIGDAWALSATPRREKILKKRKNKLEKAGSSATWPFLWPKIAVAN